MNIKFFVAFIILLPVIYCNKDHQEDTDEVDKKNWMQFLPNHVQHILKSKLTTTTVGDDDIFSSNQDSPITGDPITGSPIAGELMNASDTPEIMYGSSGSDPSNKSVPIGVSIGGIILFFLICYCCFKCCCSNRSVSQGIVIQPMQPPPPPPRDLNQPNIVIQHIHPTTQLQPGMVQQYQHTQHAPPPMVTAPQYQQPPPYPAGYETRQLLEQEWSPHAPMHPHQQQQQQQQQPYPVPDYPYNPSAPPPSYGKY